MSFLADLMNTSEIDELTIINYLNVSGAIIDGIPTTYPIIYPNNSIELAKNGITDEYIGNINSNKIIFGNIYPNIDNIYFIGNNTNKFNSGFFSNINTSNIILNSGNFKGSITLETSTKDFNLIIPTIGSTGTSSNFIMSNTKNNPFQPSQTINGALNVGSLNSSGMIQGSQLFMSSFVSTSASLRLNDPSSGFSIYLQRPATALASDTVYYLASGPSNDSVLVSGGTYGIYPTFYSDNRWESLNSFIRSTGNQNFNGNVSIFFGNLSIATEPRSGTGPTHNPPLYVTATMNDQSNGVEFRHTNQSQGVGIGFNSIYATGSITNQNLNIIPRGINGNVGINTTFPGAKLDVNGACRIQGNLNITANLNCFNTISGNTISGNQINIRDRTSAFICEIIANTSPSNYNVVIPYSNTPSQFILSNVSPSNFTSSQTITGLLNVDSLTAAYDVKALNFKSQQSIEAVTYLSFVDAGTGFSLNYQKPPISLSNNTIYTVSLPPIGFDGVFVTSARYGSNPLFYSDNRWEPLNSFVRTSSGDQSIAGNLFISGNINIGSTGQRNFWCNLNAGDDNTTETSIARFRNIFGDCRLELISNVSTAENEIAFRSEFTNRYSMVRGIRDAQPSLEFYSNVAYTGASPYGALNPDVKILDTGQTSFNYTQDSDSVFTGSLTTAGGIGCNKKIYTAMGIAFGQTQNTSSGSIVLNHFEILQHTSTFTISTFTTPNQTLILQKIGTFVHCCIKGYSLTGVNYTGNFVMNTALPSGFRPASTHRHGGIMVINLGANINGGMYEIDTAGIIRIWRDGYQTNFTTAPSSTQGWQTFSFTYSLI